MDTPATRCIGNEPVQLLCQNQGRQYVAHSVNQIGLQEPGIVVFDQPAQSSVVDGADYHVLSVRLYRSPYKPRGALTGGDAVVGPIPWSPLLRILTPQRLKGDIPSPLKASFRDRSSQ